MHWKQDIKNFRKERAPRTLGSVWYGGETDMVRRSGKHKVRQERDDRHAKRESARIERQWWRQHKKGRETDWDQWDTEREGSKKGNRQNAQGTQRVSSDLVASLAQYQIWTENLVQLYHRLSLVLWSSIRHSIPVFVLNNLTSSVSTCALGVSEVSAWTRSLVYHTFPLPFELPRCHCWAANTPFSHPRKISQCTAFPKVAAWPHLPQMLDTERMLRAEKASGVDNQCPVVAQSAEKYSTVNWTDLTRPNIASTQAIRKNSELKKKFSFLIQRLTLLTIFDIFVVTNFLPKLVDMLLFCTKKTAFPFFEIPIFGYCRPLTAETCRWPEHSRSRRRMWRPVWTLLWRRETHAVRLESVSIAGCISTKTGDKITSCHRIFHSASRVSRTRSQVSGS